MVSWGEIADRCEVMNNGVKIMLGLRNGKARDTPKDDILKDESVRREVLYGVGKILTYKR